MTHTPIKTELAPQALGPYSQGIEAFNGSKKMVFVSGQIPVDPKTGKLVQGNIQEATRMCLKNIEAILQEAHLELGDVVRVEIFMTDLSKFLLLNEEYLNHFKGPVFPARQTVEVAKLPRDAEIEISCIAIGPKDF